jgi:hypothetical protein
MIVRLLNEEQDQTPAEKQASMTWAQRLNSCNQPAAWSRLSREVAGRRSLPFGNSLIAVISLPVKNHVNT